MRSKMRMVPGSINNYFITLTVVEWIDVFTRPVYRHILIDSLKYCQLHKGLKVYAWCLMSNHIHMIVGSEEGFELIDAIRDFKKFTSKAILRQIDSPGESRRKWMLERFRIAGQNHPKTKNFKFWKDGTWPLAIGSKPFLMQKLHYIHKNPVAAEIVERPVDYLYSSARNYAGAKGLIDVVLLE